MVSKESQYEVPGAQRVEMRYLRRFRDSQEIYQYQSQLVNPNNRLQAIDQNQRQISEEHRVPSQSSSISSNVDENHEQIQGRVMINQEIQCNLGSLPQISRFNNTQSQSDSQGQSYSQYMQELKKLEDDNKILKQTIEIYKRRLQAVINQQTDSNQLIEVFEKSLQEIEKQDFFEKHFFDKVEKTLKNTEFSAKMLSNLINDMLDLAKYDAGTFRFYNEFFDLSEVIQNAFETVRFQSDKKGITLGFEVLDERTKKQQNKSLRDQAHSEELRKEKDLFNPLNGHHQLHQSSEEIASQINNSNIGQNRKSSDYQSNLSQMNWQERISNIEDPKLFFWELFGDKNRYTQIVLNFLSNAIHYSKKNGKIIMRLVLMEDQQIKSRPCLVDSHKFEISSSSLVQQSAHTRTEDNKGTFSRVISTNKLTNKNDCIGSYELQRSQDELNSLAVHGPNEGSYKAQSQIPYIYDNKLGLSEPNISYKKLSRGHEDIELKFITFRIEIEDNGVGIKKENLKSLFKDFNRLDTSLSKKGTGLGLSICKSLIEKMGGKVDVESEFGKGSNFKIQLSTKTNPQFAYFKNREGRKQKESELNADCDLENDSMSAQQALLQASEKDASYQSQSIDFQSQIIKPISHISAELNQNIKRFQTQMQNNINYQQLQMMINQNQQNNSLQRPKINNDKLLQTNMNHRYEFGSTLNAQLQFQLMLFQMSIQRSQQNVLQIEDSNSYQSNRIKDKAQKISNFIKYQEPENEKSKSSDSSENSSQSQDRNPGTMNSSYEFQKPSLGIFSFGDNNVRNNQPEVELNQCQISEESKEESKKCNEPENPEPQVAEFRCLLANDCDLQLMVMKLNLERCGVTVIDAINGQEALEQVIESTFKFDFIVLDLNMPIMDGFESAKRIINHCQGQNVIFQDNSCNSFNRDRMHDQSMEIDKSLDFKSQHILDIYEEMGQVPFLVACSTHVNDELTKKCLNIGFNAIIQSPLTVQNIESEILKHLRKDRLQRQILEDEIQKRQSQQKSIYDRVIQIQEGSVLSGGNMQINSHNSGS